MSVPPTLSVLTLNVWGLKFISKDRTPRIAAIAEYLATHAEPTAQPGTGFDIVCLQECWVEKDFDTIKTACKDVFPYSRYFHTYVPFPLFRFVSPSLYECVGYSSCYTCEFPFVSVVMRCHIPFWNHDAHTMPCLLCMHIYSVQMMSNCDRRTSSSPFDLFCSTAAPWDQGWQSLPSSPSYPRKLCPTHCQVYRWQ